MPVDTDRCRTCGKAWWDHCGCFTGGVCSRPTECHTWVVWADRPRSMECAETVITWHRGPLRWVDECTTCVWHGQCRWVCGHANPGPCSDLIFPIGAPRE